MLFTALSYAQGIELNGTISAQDNQIKDVAEPTETQDAVTKNYIDILIADLNSKIADLDSRIIDLEPDPATNFVVSTMDTSVFVNGFTFETGPECPQSIEEFYSCEPSVVINFPSSNTSDIPVSINFKMTLVYLGTFI